MRTIVIHLKVFLKICVLLMPESRNLMPFSSYFPIEIVKIKPPRNTVSKLSSKRYFTSLVSRSIDHSTIGTFLHRDKWDLYRKRSVFFQTSQFWLKGVVVCSQFSASSVVMPISGEFPDSSIPITSLEVSKADFADDPVQLFRRRGLELDHDWGGTCVVRGHVYRREIWSWM